VLDGARVRALRAGLRASSGLLRRGHLHQLRRELGDRGRRLLRAVGLVRSAQPAAVRDLGAISHRVSPVVLSLQPELLAGDRVLGESRTMNGDLARTVEHGGCGRMSHPARIRGGIGGDAASPPMFTVSSPPIFIAKACRPYITLLVRSEEHTSELQSRSDLVCRLLLEK